MNPFNARYDDQGAWRAEVDTGEGRWYTNALTFDSESDAADYARDLACRWTLVRGTRVVPMVTPLRETVSEQFERCPVCGGLNPGDITHSRC